MSFQFCNALFKHLPLRAMVKRVFLFSLLLAAHIALFAQADQVADKIIAVVGNKIILQSDLNIRMIQNSKQGGATGDSAECENFRDMIGEKILAEEALRDSTIAAKVTDEAVDAQVQQNIDHYVRGQFDGNIKQMESYLGKTVYQLKEESREPTRDNMLATEMRSKIIQDVKVTPEEVKAFFNALPDSDKPMVPASVEIGQIVINPDISPEIDKYTRQKLEDIRSQIVDSGKDFGLMAGIYSQDPGSKDNGGQYTIDRKNFDPAFVSAAFRLQPGEVSPVVKTQFGYHIIKMEKRMGDQAMVRHILLIPDITSVDIQKTMDSLQKVYQDLKDKKTTFQAAVAKYSNDKNSKMTGGMLMDMNSGSTLLELDQLDPQMSAAVSDMKPGDFSEPQAFANPVTNQQSCRIVYLRDRTDPHQINLQDDYSKIQAAALQKKQTEYLMKWMRTNITTHYIKLDASFEHCPDLADWYGLTKQ